MASPTSYCLGGKDDVGNVYYVSGIGTVLIGVLRSISFSGDTKFDIAMSLGILDPEGLNKVYVGIGSPDKKARLTAICYAENFNGALEQLRAVFDDYIQWRLKSPFEASPIEIQIQLMGNMRLKFKVMPVTLTITPEPGSKIIEVELAGALQAYEGPGLPWEQRSSWKVE